MPFAFFMLGVLLLILQTTLFHLLPSWLGRPDLLFLLLIFIALYLDTVRGLVLTLLLGMAMDVFSGMLMGIYPLAYLLIFAAIRLISRNLALEDSVHQVPLVVVCFLAVSAIIHLLVSLLVPETSPYWPWPQLLQNLVILAVICLPFFHLCQRLQALLAERPPLSISLFQRRSPNRFKV